MLNQYLLRGCGIGILFAGVLIAADSSKWDFKTVKAKAAVVKYELAVKNADAAHDRAIADARKQFINELDHAKVEATKSGNLDEAIRLREAIKDMNDSQPIQVNNTIESDRDRLTAKLVGTTWTGNKNETIQYKTNGMGTNGELDFKWAAIDSHRVVWYWTKSSYITFVVFDAELSHYDTYSLGHTDLRKAGPDWSGRRVK